jgi:hypothetical protein
MKDPELVKRIQAILATMRVPLEHVDLGNTIAWYSVHQETFCVESYDVISLLSRGGESHMDRLVSSVLS